MKMLRSNSPFMNSVYQQNFIPKAAINEECPFKKLQEFQYKPKNSDIEKMMSTYKVFFFGSKKTLIFINHYIRIALKNIQCKLKNIWKKKNMKKIIFLCFQAPTIT